MTILPVTVRPADMATAIGARQINPAALREARLKTGDGTKSGAARAAGMTWMGYRRWEQEPGPIKFDHNKFAALCRYLNVTADQITMPVPAVSTELDTDPVHT